MVVTILVQHTPTSSHRKNGYVGVIGVLGFSLCVVQVLPVLPPWSYVEELYGATSGELTISLGVPGLERSVATTLKSFGAMPKRSAAPQHGCRDGRCGCAIMTRPVTGSVSGPIGSIEDGAGGSNGWLLNEVRCSNSLPEPRLGLEMRT